MSSENSGNSDQQTPSNNHPTDTLHKSTRSPTHAHKHEMEEHSSYRNYMRDLILGANDGLVSVFALVLGVAGGGFLPNEVLIAGIAAAVAGAISMAIGEYLSTKSQEEVYDAERSMELSHIREFHEHERDELYDFYRAKGFEDDILEEIVDTIAADEKVMLDEMMMAEFGVLEEERRSPITATIIVGIAFFFGSLPPVVPFFFVTTTIAGVYIAGVASVIGLFFVGGLKAKITRQSIWPSGTENMALGLIGALVTYGIGVFIGGSVA